MPFPKSKGVIALWGAALAALLLFIAVPFVTPMFKQTVADTLGHGDYRLQGTDGAEFTEDTLAGAPSAVFFGFTHCPEVCPTTLGDIATWQADLAGQGADLRVFFVTVDPERDGLDTLDGYVSWVPGVVGVTGSRAEIDKAIKAFRIYAKRIALDDGGYTMDHTATVLLFDADGRFAELIGYREDPDRVRQKLDRLLAG